MGAYCEDPGRGPLSLGGAEPGDYIVFLGGLAKYPSGTFDLRPRFSAIMEAYNRAKRGIYIIAYMQVVKTIDIPQEASEISSLQIVEPRIEHLLPRLRGGIRIYFDRRPARVLEKPVRIGVPAGKGKIIYSIPLGLKGVRSGRLWLKTMLKGKKAELVLEYLEMLPSRESELWGWKY